MSSLTIATVGLAKNDKDTMDRNNKRRETIAQLREALNHAWSHAEQTDREATAASSDPPGSASESQSETERARVAAQRKWDHLRKETRMPKEMFIEWPSNTGGRLVRNNLPPQSLWAPEATRLNAKRRRYTWKKLAIQELSVGLLIHDLIQHVALAKFSKSAYRILKPLSPHILEIAAFDVEKIARQRLELLENINTLENIHINSPDGNMIKEDIRRNHIGIPSYYQDADGDFHQICKQMNDGVEQLFQPVIQGNEREKALAVAKICHNLLVSTASPDLRTFNLLLSGFTVWRASDLIDSVIASLRASKIRPNETTCRLILEHYIRQNRPDSFSRFVAKMRGINGGLMLADPNVQVNVASEGRLVRDPVKINKVYQKVYPTPLVFSSLINGVLHFAGFDRALDIYYELKNDGWGLPVLGLTKLLADCVRRGDWEGGAYVWEEINSIKDDSRKEDMARAYHHMLILCSITGNTVAFNQVLNELVKRGHDRFAIITAAMKTARSAQYKKSYLAPAWAADNLMIAVSDYIADAKSAEQPEEIDATEDELSLDMASEFGPDGALENVTSHQSCHPSAGQHSDAKEAWSDWVEREFGERPKDPEL